MRAPHLHLGRGLEALLDSHLLHRHPAKTSRAPHGSGSPRDTPASELPSGTKKCFRSASYARVTWLFHRGQDALPPSTGLEEALGALALLPGFMTFLLSQEEAPPNLDRVRGVLEEL